MTEVLFGPSFPTLLGSETTRRQEAPGSEYIQVVLSRISPHPMMRGWDWGKLVVQNPDLDPRGQLRKVKARREQR